LRSSRPTGWLKKSKLLYCVNSLLFLSHPVYEVVFVSVSVEMGSNYMNELDVYVLRWNSYRLKDFEKELVEC